MSIQEFLLSEFDQEMKNTRRLLERMPPGKADWKPHPKSMPMGRLAGHVAELPGWAEKILNLDSLDLAPMVSAGFQGYSSGSREELLETLDKNVAEARNALVQATEESLGKVWSLLFGGKVIASMPRIAMLRNMVMNHLIHHRAQLGVYFRLHDIPLPDFYGASADEGMRMVG
jgi:uncharacterized damage-inducible protein DinB